jgi:predicted lactoylglutathione lyase
MTVPQRLSAVTLGVADVAQATQFYESLGWRRSSGSQEMITFCSLQGGSVLGLFGTEPLADDAGVPAEGSGFRSVTHSIAVDSRETVDAAFGEWVAAGATPVKQPHVAEWGGYTSYVADPDGHLWEILHNPYWPNDEQGRMQLPD